MFSVKFDQILFCLENITLYSGQSQFFELVIMRQAKFVIFYQFWQNNNLLNAGSKIDVAMLNDRSL